VGMNATVLIVDDDGDLLDLLSMNLIAEGYVVRTASSGAEAITNIRANRPDILLLDIMLDDISGIKLTGKLKNSADTAALPIILITAKDSEADIIIGYGVGADDYVTKPFSTRVLVAHIEAVLTRAYPDGSSLSNVLSAGPLKIIPDSRQVLLNGTELSLTGGEYNILTALVRASGKVLSRDELKLALGQNNSLQKDRIIDVHIAALRRKLAAAKGIIKTIHGVGYRIDC
jgi:DNA-binding response OmpR family regulator